MWFVSVRSVQADLVLLFERFQINERNSPPAYAIQFEV